MEYRYQPTPEKEQEKSRIVKTFVDCFVEVPEERKNPMSTPVQEFMARTLFETQNILGISDYDLTLEPRELFSPAEASITAILETGELVPHLSIDYDFLERMAQSEENIWEYTIAHVVAHESHHLRQFELCASLRFEEAEYNLEGLSGEESSNLWKRHLPEFAAELFAYNYVLHKFSDRAGNATFQGYIRYMKRNLDDMTRLMKEQGRSYGIKNTKALEQLKQIKEREQNRSMNFF